MEFTRIRYFLKRTALNFLGTFFDFLILNKSPKSIDNKSSILIIKMDAIGDFIVWMSVAKKYRELFTSDNFKLTLLTNPACKELAENLAVFDEIKVIERKKYMLNFNYRRLIFNDLNTLNYDSIIYHAISREFASGDLLVKKLSSKNKIGVYSDYAIDSKIWSNISDKWFTKLTHIQSKQELIRNYEFMEFLGLINLKPELPNIKIDSETIINKKYIVIAPGARVGYRKWAKENFVEICEYILHQTDFDILLCGGKSEIEDGNYIASQINNTRIVNKIGKTSILELCKIIKDADLLIGNETSSVHIAAAVQTTSLCILGGGHFNRFVPYPEEIISEFKPIPVFKTKECFGCDWRCKFEVSTSKPFPCIDEISTQRVINELEKIIK